MERFDTTARTTSNIDFLDDDDEEEEEEEEKTGHRVHSSLRGS